MTGKIAITCGGGYVPGLDALIAGAALAAGEAGQTLVGIHDGFDGLLAPADYPEGGLVRLDRDAVEAGAGSLLGTAARRDPFRVRTITDDNFVTEADRSDDLLAALKAAGISAVIAVTGGSALTGAHAMSVALRLSRKGLPMVCIPKSVENDIGATSLCFGYDSALGLAADLLDRIRLAARDVRRLAVVEVPGAEAGWLALQAGLAARADAILIPEIPHDIAALAAALQRQGRRPALVVVAAGARARQQPGTAPAAGLRKSLSPLSDPAFGEGSRVIDRSGAAAQTVALDLQRLTGIETLAQSLDHLVRTGPPTAIDRQLALVFGAGAVRAVLAGETRSVLCFHPPALSAVPLAEAVNHVRRVPLEGELVRTARAVGISLGDAPERGARS